MDQLPPVPPALHGLPQRIILGSRWLLIVFYGVLTAALACYAAVFATHFAQTVPKLFAMSETELILAVLGLVDGTLIASLIVMVIISGYDNFVGSLGTGDSSLSWLGSIDPGALKIKIATSIVAISAIQLLEVFLNAEHYSNGRIAWAVILHLTFVVSAVGLGILDRLTRH